MNSPAPFNNSDVMETVFSQLHIYQVCKREGKAIIFDIYRDGKRWEPGFKSLSLAISVARSAD
jgi:hypothetical protein